MIEFLFGVPFYKSTVNPHRYNKLELIDNITHNFNLNPKRNEWDKTNTEVHHSYGDELNVDFKKPNYDSLIPIYKEHVENFLDQYFDVNIEYYFEIANYTCFGKNQYMAMHNHPRTCFSGIHYIKFNPN